MSGWYYCPDCGEGYSGPDAETRRAWVPFIVDYFCPECDRRLYISGKQMILFGFLGWMVCEIFFEGPLAEKYGLIWFGALLAMGLLRIQKQWDAWSANFKRQMMEAEARGAKSADSDAGEQTADSEAAEQGQAQTPPEV